MVLELVRPYAPRRGQEAEDHAAHYQRQRSADGQDDGGGLGEPDGQNAVRVRGRRQLCGQGPRALGDGGRQNHLPKGRHRGDRVAHRFCGPGLQCVQQIGRQQPGSRQRHHRPLKRGQPGVSERGGPAARAIPCGSRVYSGCYHRAGSPRAGHALHRQASDPEPGQPARQGPHAQGLRRHIGLQGRLRHDGRRRRDRLLGPRWRQGREARRGRPHRGQVGGSPPADRGGRPRLRHSRVAARLERLLRAPGEGRRRHPRPEGRHLVLLPGRSVAGGAQGQRHDEGQGQAHQRGRRRWRGRHCGRLGRARQRKCVHRLRRRLRPLRCVEHRGAGQPQHHHHQGRQEQEGLTSGSRPVCPWGVHRQPAARCHLHQPAHGHHLHLAGLRHRLPGRGKASRRPAAPKRWPRTHAREARRAEEWSGLGFAILCVPGFCGTPVGWFCPMSGGAAGKGPCGTHPLALHFFCPSTHPMALHFCCHSTHPMVLHFWPQPDGCGGQPPAALAATHTLG
ncbi:hypothetical protein Rsub_00505 [Raphidocelis subcapitata]|uniref:Uncharacterized protein n=1 Tax=Raphidocelis subcapitata TaxID=307507 RepID=A0A2V0NKE8_9CHLO|nr:hypothetical protein Rsub_00505 [Raphidocelis subcapitata]|eukprot:GBF87794.1 hypothetical protein Rsub_00505 [Raphidocelis subcapitata]